MIISRRGLITGLVGLIAAPAIVRVENLMKVKAVLPQLTEETILNYMIQEISLGYSITRQAINENLYKFGYAAVKQEGTNFECMGIEEWHMYANEMRA